MRYLNNNKGIALITVLIMSVIALSLTAALLNFMIIGTKKSGALKSYETVGQAADAALDISTQLITNRGSLNITALNIANSNPCTCGSAFNYNNASNTCFCDKMCNSRYTIGQAGSNWPECTVAAQTNFTIDPTNANSYDMTFTLGSTPNQFNAYLKIVDTVQGNTSTVSGVLRGSGAVASNSGIANTELNPYIYRIEILALRVNGTVNATTDNTTERSLISLLYAY
jgi:Tfp pilus assembly protein PilX